MAKFNFNLRYPNAKDESAIHLIIRWKNNRLVFHTQKSIRPMFWENNPQIKNYQRVKQIKEFPTHRNFNAVLENILTDAKNVFYQFEKEHNLLQPTIEELRELLNQKINNTEDQRKPSFFSFFETFIAETKYRTNTKTQRKFSPATIKTYSNTLKTLLEFQKKTRKKVEFKKIDLEFYYSFIKFLEQEKLFTLNTIGKHIKILKVVLNDATDRGHNSNMIFKNRKFVVPTEVIESIALSQTEVNEIYELDLSHNKKLDQVRDLFIVGCCTGLRYGDLKQLNEINFNTNELIQVKTEKTNTNVLIPIHQMVRKIRNKYNGMPFKISNQKFNMYIKEVGKLIPCLEKDITIKITKGGEVVTIIKKKFEFISAHTSRRTFATNLYLTGFPSYHIMKITGHKTEVAFLKYIKITPHDSANRLLIHMNQPSKLIAV